uniref:Uncharacterized protein n=1 Tax=Rhizophora mucronata TaxID=61149 RepID=A0A2P2N0C1_RHIMU
MQFLLKSDRSIVEEILKKHSDELLITVNHQSSIISLL